MSNQITKALLQMQVDRLNTAAGYELEPYGPRTETDRCNPRPNVYHLDWAYGGVALHQMLEEGTGINSISHNGYGTKRELHTFMCGMLANVVK